MEISLLVALAIVLDLVSVIYSRWIWAQGGSITAAIVPMAIIAFRHGPALGIFGGLALGLIRFMIGPVYAPWQIIWDFLLPSIGSTFILGLWSKKIRGGNRVRLTVWVSVFFACAFSFLSHWWSGVILFYMFNPRPDEWSTYMYSFVYNFPQEFFNWILGSLILTVLIKRYDFVGMAGKNRLQRTN